MSIPSPFDTNRFEIDQAGYANGVAGTYYQFPAFSGALYEIVNITCQLTTDVNVADRTVFLDIRKGLIFSSLAPSPRVQVANTTRTYVFAQGTAPSAEADPYIRVCTVPPYHLIAPGDLLLIRIANQQAADQIVAVRAYFNKFPPG